MSSEKNEFLIGLSIVLATITVGLISYLFYSSHLNQAKEVPRCEYDGWAYGDQESFDSTDGCNVCFCDDGEVICTEKLCIE